MSRLEYASQLWSPYLLKHVYLSEKVQRGFTKHRYGIIYVWKKIEGLVPNLSDPITCSFTDRRGRACVVCHSGAGRLGTLKYNSFRWRSIKMFNRLPKSIRMLSSCSVVGLKSKIDSYLRNIMDLPCRPGFNKSGRWGLLTWWSLRR